MACVVCETRAKARLKSRLFLFRLVYTIKRVNCKIRRRDVVKLLMHIYIIILYLDYLIQLRRRKILVLFLT